MQRAKVFSDESDQIVYIPEEFQFNVNEVYVNKIGETLVLTPIAALSDAFDKGIGMLTEDFLGDGIPESLPSKRQPL